MKKLALVCVFFSGFALTGFGQAKERLHKAVTDPARELNSGKADGYIQDKTIISEKQQKKASRATPSPKKGNCCRKTCGKKN